MTEMTDKQAGSLDLVYGLEDKPPFGNTLLSTVTHPLAIFAPMIAPAPIVGGASELPVEMTAYLVSVATVASGVGTYLQVNRFEPVGSGMLSIQSVNFSFVTMMIALGTGMREGGLTEDAMISALLGVSFVGAFLVCFSAWPSPYLKKAIMSTVSDVVVMLTGLSLVHVDTTDFGGGSDTKADGTFGLMENLGLTSLVLLIVLVFNCLKNPLLRISGTAVGLTVGYIAALFLGKVDSSALQSLPLITLPVLFKYGFALDWYVFIVAGVIFLLSILEAVGNLTVTAMVFEQPIEDEEYTKRLHGGVLADGLVFVIAAALGSLSLTALVQNNSMIQITGVASHHVDKYIAAILVLSGLSPVIGRTFITIPSLVLGGTMVLIFDLTAIADVRVLVSHGTCHHETVIAATSVGSGLGVASEPEVFENLPVLFQNSISAGGIMVILLSLVLLEDRTGKAVKVETDSLDH